MIHAYRLNGYNIVLDVASGCVHAVDDAAYDAILMFDLGNGGEVTKTLSAKYPDMSEDDISGVIAEIVELEQKGRLFSQDVFDRTQGHSLDGGQSGCGPVSTKNDASLKALCMNVSHICNMSCAYCFAGQGMYSGDGGLMSLETGKRAIDFLVENSGGHINIDVDFFGGEPLMNFEVVKGIVGYARTLEQGSGKRFRFTLTTNGLLIDDAVIEFANKEIHNVVLSIDGRPEVNDAMRRLPDGSGSYSCVLPKIKKLVEARVTACVGKSFIVENTGGQGVACDTGNPAMAGVQTAPSGGKGYYIRGTFTRDNLDFLSDVLHLADLGFTELSMEPVVSKPGAPYALTLEDLPKISTQYEALASQMLERGRKGKDFTFYHYKLDLVGGPCIHKRIAGCGVGTSYMAVTPQGELYPCHQFVGEREFLLGDVWRGVSNDRLRDEIGRQNIYTRAECKACWARMYCSGGCAANAYHASGDIGGIYELGCGMFKKRMECAIMLSVAGTLRSNI